MLFVPPPRKSSRASRRVTPLNLEAPSLANYPPPTASPPSTQHVTIPPRDELTQRWSYLSSPPPDLSLTSPDLDPPSPLPFATARFSGTSLDVDRRNSFLSATNTPPESPSSPIVGTGAERQGYEIGGGDQSRQSMAQSFAADGSSLMIDPQMARWTAVMARDRDYAALSSSQRSRASSIASRGRPGPLHSTPPPSSPQLLAPPFPHQVDIAGRPLPTAAPSADPRFAFNYPPPVPPPSPRRLATALGGLASRARGKSSATSSLAPSVEKKRPNDPFLDSSELSYLDPTPSRKQPIHDSPPRATAKRRSQTDPQILLKVAPDPPKSHRPNSGILETVGAENEPPFVVPHLRPPAPPFLSPGRPRSRTLESMTSEEMLADGDFHRVAELAPRRRASILQLNNLPPVPSEFSAGSPSLSPHPLPFLSNPPTPSQAYSPYAYPSPSATHGHGTPLLTPPLSKQGSFSSTRFPFPAPNAPPSTPIPPVPDFTAVFVDPATDTVPISVSHLLPVPTESKPTERTLRRRVSDWLMRKSSRQTLPEASKSASDTNLPLEDLVRRAVEVEARLATGTDSPPNTKGMKRRSRGRNQSLPSLPSRMSFANSIAGRQSWSRVADDDTEDADKLRRRELKRKKLALEGRRKTQDWLAQVSPTAPRTSIPKWRRVLAGTKHPPSKPLLSSRRFQVLLTAGLLIIGIIIAVALGVTLSSRKSSTVGDCSCENGGTASVQGSNCACSCKGSWGGSFCQLDGTCKSFGSYSVAKGLLSTATNANSAATFASSPINSTRLALVVNEYLAPSSSSCKDHLSLLALPNLPPTRYPTRLAWTSQAVLWNLFQTESNSTGFLRFAAAVDFASLNDTAASPNSNFQYLAGGHIFDLAAMTVTTPAASWESSASPSADQVALVAASSTAGKVLDLVTQEATADSTQRQTALKHRWAELSLASADLDTFREKVQNATVIVPFDPTYVVEKGVRMMSLAKDQTNETSFPPAIGCLPGLRAKEVEEINNVEFETFGLDLVSSGQMLNGSCLDRPLYGVLNLLNLRLPFADSDPRTNLSKQGIVLSPANYVRSTIHAGELLVGALSGPFSAPSSSSNISHFGTFESLDHIILDYLDLLAPVVAQELVAFVLANSAGDPPSSTSALGSSLAKLPLVEVQLWGGLRYDSIENSVSSMSVSSGDEDLFFGTTVGEAFRSWALNGPDGRSTGQGAIEWTLDATEQQSVSDSKLTGSTFASFWNATAGGNATATPTTVWNALLAAGLGA